MMSEILFALYFIQSGKRVQEKEEKSHHARKRLRYPSFSSLCSFSSWITIVWNMLSLSLIAFFFL